MNFREDFKTIRWIVILIFDWEQQKLGTKFRKFWDIFNYIDLSFFCSYECIIIKCLTIECCKFRCKQQLYLINFYGAQFTKMCVLSDLEWAFHWSKYSIYPFKSNYINWWVQKHRKICNNHIFGRIKIAYCDLVEW